jgi:hypothetical protein
MTFLAHVVCFALAASASSPAVPAVAATNAPPAVATNVPSAAVDFNLAGGVVWKKFIKIKDRFVLGQPAEGKALAIFNASLRSKNAELVAEARSILDAIAETREVLGERLAAARAEGKPDAEEWIELYLRSYPSRRARFARRAKRREAKAGNPAASGK